MHLYKTPTPKPQGKTTVLASAALHSQHKPGEAILVFYRTFPWVTKTPNNKPRLKTYQNKKALLPEGVSNSLCLCVSSCCLHTAKVTASLQAQDWSLYARGFDELQWDLMGGSPNRVCPAFPSPSLQQPREQSLFPCH